MQSLSYKSFFDASPIVLKEILLKWQTKQHDWGTFTYV